jgi:hypothetical protein
VCCVLFGSMGMPQLVLCVVEAGHVRVCACAHVGMLAWPPSCMMRGRPGLRATSLPLLPPSTTHLPLPPPTATHATACGHPSLSRARLADVQKELAALDDALTPLLLKYKQVRVRVCAHACVCVCCCGAAAPHAAPWFTMSPLTQEKQKGPDKRRRCCSCQVTTASPCRAPPRVSPSIT